ncbi:hypothetical protein PENTCL1PPCAC_9953 [Pristionchus entomophagus]|uniref:BZIP domain-containing protein n=1 Tax=Pristionchus entomophagus TaxID=358040 RepID=A0AAV5T4L5_9BILA|nr:hypothetical protein PENTCL1PPCAC_9953 [Pristionchus entomophagus]
MPEEPIRRRLEALLLLCRTTHHCKVARSPLAAHSMVRREWSNRLEGLSLTTITWLYNQSSVPSTTPSTPPLAGAVAQPAGCHEVAQQPLVGSSSNGNKARSSKPPKRKMDAAQLREYRNYKRKTDAEKAADPDYDNKRERNKKAVRATREKKELQFLEEYERNVEILQRLHYVQESIKRQVNTLSPLDPMTVGLPEGCVVEEVLFTEEEREKAGILPL